MRNNGDCLSAGVGRSLSSGSFIAIKMMNFYNEFQEQFEIAFDTALCKKFTRSNFKPKTPFGELSSNIESMKITKTRDRKPFWSFRKFTKESRRRSLDEEFKFLSVSKPLVQEVFGLPVIGEQSIDAEIEPYMQSLSLSESRTC